MTKCDYCGKANEEDSLSCLECGTPLPATEEVEGHKVTRIASTPAVPQLDARRATRILAVVLVAALLGGCLVAAVGAVVFIAQGNDLQGARQARHFTRIMTDPIAALMTAVAGVVMLRMSCSLPREALSDGSPVGAAWTVGSSKQIVQGLACCTLVGLTIAIVFAHQAGPRAFGPVKTLAAVALAPPVEELLFRGLLYGGYRRSFGPVWAAVLTTILFCLMHIGKIMHSPLAAVGIPVMAMAALWFRLRSAAIGPAVAAHLGYNAAIALVVFCHSFYDPHTN
jgi:membrane protease YdiL (CAAX protease family)